MTAYRRNSDRRRSVYALYRILSPSTHQRERERTDENGNIEGLYTM